jgi:hypothetical protein
VSSSALTKSLQSQEKYLKVFYQYEPFWKLLTQEASAKVRKDNYQRIFDVRDEESDPGASARQVSSPEILEV